MHKRLPLILLAAAASLSALGADVPTCARDPRGADMEARIDQMGRQLDRMQVLSDRAEQRRVMELHAKHMHEGARELRRRRHELPPDCHAELMQSLLEQVIAHQQVAEDLGQR